MAGAAGDSVVVDLEVWVRIVLGSCTGSAGRLLVYESVLTPNSIV